MHQFESDFGFDMDDNFSMCSQPSLSCTSTGTSFSSTSSVYDPFTPSSRRSSPNELHLDFNDGACNYNGATDQQPLNMTSPTNMSKFMFGPVKQEPEQVSFTTETMLPSTPMKKMEGSYDYEQMLEMNMTATHGSMGAGTVTPSNTFGMDIMSPEISMGATSYMMTPTRSLSSASEIADPVPWSMTHESPITFFNGMSAPVDMERHSQSPLHNAQQPYSLQSNGHSPANRFRMQRKMMHEAQRKSSELQRAQIRATRTRTEKVDHGTLDVVRRAMCKCDYPGCTKAFRRNEHLKRHKQTFHGEGPNRFSCEFCGKDQFNRQDNLNNHRKLHARPNSRNRGVEFMPHSVPIIEQEERSRKRRAPPKSKQAAERRHLDG